MVQDPETLHKVYTKVLRECGTTIILLQLALAADFDSIVLAGRTLAIMSPTTGPSPYAHPQWLSRAWCIMEGYETVAAGLHLTVGLTAQETAEIRKLLRSRDKRIPFLRSMTTADVHRAKSFANKSLVAALVSAAPEGAKSIVSFRVVRTLSIYLKITSDLLVARCVAVRRTSKFPKVCSSGAWRCLTET